MKPHVELLAHQPAVCRERATTVQLLIRVNAPPPKQRQRPPLNIGLAIDRSGSMGGTPMERAIQAAVHVVERLRPNDLISVVSFDSQVDVLTPCQPVGNVRAIVKSLQALTARGGTNLHGGWSEACEQVSRRLGQGRLSRVLLLSDGGANEGLSDPLRLAQEAAGWQRRGVTTTTIGLGSGYNEDLMASMARAGNGSFYHVQTPADIVSTFQVELLGMLSTFGQAVSLGIQPAPGVELIRVVNVLEQTEKGRLKLADLVHGCPLEVVVELLVAAHAQEKDLCRFRLAWTDLEHDRRCRLVCPLRLPLVPQGQLSEFPVNAEVAQKRALKLSARHLLEAMGYIDRRDRPGARAALQAGLDLVKEAQPCPELSDMVGQFQRLLQQLDGGDTGSVRKAACFSSSSVSLGSISMSRAVRQFMELPPEQRTPERFEELRRTYGDPFA